MARAHHLFFALALVSSACGREPAPVAAVPVPTASSSSPPAASPRPDVTLSILGTSDLHGHVDALPVLSAFVTAVRHANGDDHVLLLDAGDMFQGTLESNMNEGAAVVRAYNVIRYDAAAIGNHEFDFGPTGAPATPRSPADDPRGALCARAAEAHFPFLLADVQDTQTGKAPAWPNVVPSVVVVKDGVRVGVIGVTSADTPRTTISANFVGLSMIPLEQAVTHEAESVRARGADIVVLAAHAGGKCKNVTDPASDGQCDPHQEIMALLRSLPAGTLDAVVAGHTHAGMATVVNGVPVVQSFANGRAFGRIDLTIDAATKKVVRAKVFPTQDLALPATYEGTPLAPDPQVAAAFAEDVARARAKKEQKLGVTLPDGMRRSHDHESPEGNLFADLMRASHPHADVAIANGGSLRTDLPAGDLTYGPLFEAMPFDNRFAVYALSGAELRHVLAQNAADSHGILSISGIFVDAACAGGALKIDIHRRAPNGGRGAEIKDTDKLTLVTSDFLALGGDETGLPAGRATIEDMLVRDALEAGLTRGPQPSQGAQNAQNAPKNGPKAGTRIGAQSATIRERDVFDPAHPRWTISGARPLSCKP